jgi:hypothetical protein
MEINLMNFVIPKVGAKQELLLNKPGSGSYGVLFTIYKNF